MALTLSLGGAASAAPLLAAPDSPWTWPLSGIPPVTRGFSPPEVRYGTGHRGVDLSAEPGATVLAAGAGRVSYAGLLAGRGVVVVQHGELRTTYEPVTAQVGVGQQVARGAPLGRLEAGHAGCTAPACLHWGLRRGEQYLDPLSLVGAGPVRLLPVLDPGGRAPAPPAVSGVPGVPGAPGARSARAPVGPGAELPAPPPDSPAVLLRAASGPAGALALLMVPALLVRRVRRRGARRARADRPLVGPQSRC